jgi:hypothetical protein
MKRKRGPRPKDPRLAPYPGLTEFRGYYYVRHPITGRRGSLGTKDLNEAIVRYQVAQAKWKDEVEETLADQIVEKILGLRDVVPFQQKKSEETTLAGYAKYIRIEWLDFRYDDAGKLIHPIKPKLPSNSKIQKRKGKPIGVRTAKDYGWMIRYSIEESDLLAFPLSLEREESVLRMRQFLATWLNSPQHYNHVRNCLSKIYQQAIREGLRVTNPCDDIKALPTPRRNVYIDDDAYLKITAQLMTDQYVDRRTKESVTVDSEYQARAVDMLYMITGRPGDVLALEDSQFSIDAQNHAGTLSYESQKTGTVIELELNDALVDLVLWFREWKRQQNLVSRHLICYPAYYARMARHRDLVGKPLSVGFLSRRFAQAVIDAGYDKGAYRLYDNRRKGITDERRNQGGHTGKGGHKGESSELFYVVDEVPVRTKSTLARIGKSQ